MSRMRSTPLPCVAALHGLDEVLLMVVDGEIGAELSAALAFFGRARRREDACAEGLGEHDRRGADAGASAMHEEALALLQMPAVEHIGPDGEECFRDRGGLDHREALRDRQRIRRVHLAELRITPARNERADFVADAETRRALAKRGDLAGDLEAWQVGSAGRRRIMALPLQHVRAVDARRRHADENLAGAGRRHRPGLGDQRLRAAGLRDRHRRHGRGERFRHHLTLRFCFSGSRKRLHRAGARLLNGNDLTFFARAANSARGRNRHAGGD